MVKFTLAALAALAARACAEPVDFEAHLIRTTWGVPASTARPCVASASTPEKSRAGPKAATRAAVRTTHSVAAAFGSMFLATRIRSLAAPTTEAAPAPAKLVDGRRR